MKLQNRVRFIAVFSCWLALLTPLSFQHAKCSSPPLEDTVSKATEQSESRKTHVYSPPPISDERRNAALRTFEAVHPMLTIHYHGFSRMGNLICYDMLSELRTVEEARMMMDVEFYLLDRMLDHYRVRKHVRIVDVSVVKRMLDITNLVPWRLPTTVANITRLVTDYEPILKSFLKRYLPHIELLVLVNVPSLLVPIMPTVLSRMSGVPSTKIKAVPDGSGLTQFMDPKYVPAEFGNPRGVRLKESEQNSTGWVLMLSDIKEYLGEEVLTSSGKEMLEKHRHLLEPPKHPSDASSDGADTPSQGDFGTAIDLSDDSFDDID